MAGQPFLYIFHKIPYRNGYALAVRQDDFYKNILYYINTEKGKHIVDFHIAPEGQHH